MRIVSLLPSATEIVAALGLADQLVGRSHECDFPPDVERVAGALAVQARAAAVVAGLRERLDALAARTSSLAKHAVACIEWLDPLMAAGNWVPELVEIAGGRNLFGEAGEHSPWLEWDAVRRADPDVVVTMPCGFDLARTRRELSALQRLPGWPELRAVREGRLSVVDGHQYFNRPGPRLVESAEILAEILHRGVIQFGHRGRGWTPIEAAAHA